MTEAFDASRTNQLLPLLLVLLPIVCGIGLEFARRRLERRAARLEREWLEIILYALYLQPIFWLSATPALLLLLNWSENPLISGQIGIRIYSAAAMIALTIFLVRLAIGWMHLAVRRMNLGSVSLIDRLFDALGSIIVLVVVLWTVGFPVQTLLLAVAGSSVGLAFAFQQPLTNLFAGLLVAVSNRFSPGQYIRLSSGEAGHVVDIDWFTTTILQLDNNLIVVPNSMMMNLIVTNFQKPTDEMTVLVPLSVSYDSNLEHVERVTIDVATEVMREVDGGVPEWTPVIRYSEFADSAIRFNVVLRSASFLNQALVRHEFVKRITERYRQEQITIPYPIRTLQIEPTAALSANPPAPPRRAATESAP